MGRSLQEKNGKSFGRAHMGRNASGGACRSLMQTLAEDFLQSLRHECGQSGETKLWNFRNFSAGKVCISLPASLANWIVGETRTHRFTHSDNSWKPYEIKNSAVECCFNFNRRNHHGGGLVETASASHHDERRLE